MPNILAHIIHFMFYFILFYLFITLYIRVRIFDYKKNVLGARTLPPNVNPAQALRGTPGKEVQSPRLRAHIWVFGSTADMKCVSPRDESSFSKAKGVFLRVQILVNCRGARAF